MNAVPASTIVQLSVSMESQARAAPKDFVMPAGVLTHLERYGVDPEFIDKVFGPREKIRQLMNNHAALDQDSTDKAMRVIQILSLAEKVFGNSAKSLMWMNHTNKLLGDAKPMDLMARESSARFVEEALLRIEYGIAA